MTDSDRVWTYEEESIILLEGLGVGSGDAGVLWRSVHLVEDLLREGLGDLVDVGGAAGLLDAGSLLLGQLLDVAPCGVLQWLRSVLERMLFMAAVEELVRSSREPLDDVRRR